MIFPKKSDLFEKIENILKIDNRLTTPGQYIFDRYIVNVSTWPVECIELDEFGQIIDGFSVNILNNYPYKGQLIHTLLGGNEKNHNFNEIFVFGKDTKPKVLF